MRRSLILTSAGFIFVLGTQIGCGGYGGSTNTPKSGLNERVFATLQNPSSGSGFLTVVDASKDQLTANTVSLAGSSPALMVPGANNTTLVVDASSSVSIVDNIKEVIAANETGCPTGVNCFPSLPGTTESVVASSDGKFAYAAIPSSGQVSVLALTAGPPITVTNVPATPSNCQTTKNCLPGAHRIVLSHNNSKLLVFNESLNQLEVLNTSDNSVQTVAGAGFDHPAFGVFSSDDSKAYILNCGAECGGTQASVAVLDMTALTVGTPVNVDAATIGTADAANLYVAGSNPATPGAGSLTILPISSLSGGKQVKIGDGFHQVISLFENKVIVGARTCTTGCLSIADPGATTAIVDTPAAGQTQKGDVTAVSGVTPRTVFYAAEGGEVRVYDVATGAEHLTNNTPVIDLVGKVTGVLYVGPKT